MRIFGAIVALLIVVGLFAFIYQHKRSGEVVKEGSGAARVTLTGTYGCLPQKDTTAITTDECAFGIRTDDGLYYAIDFGLVSTLPPVLTDGTRIRATGRVTPLIALSTDYWQKYPIEGIFSVTDSLEVLEEVDIDTEIEEESSSNSRLFDNSWVWVRTEYLDGDILQSRTDRFVLTFNEAGTMNSSTDCNSLSGDFVIDGEVLSFGPFMSTLMYCDGSLEGDYGSNLALTNSYTIVGDELRLNLDRDFGVMVFRPAD